MNPNQPTRGKDWHHERVTEVIARAAAQFIAKEAGSESLITVTHAHQLANGERIVIFVSVFPDTQARSALAFLERHREEFSDHLKAHARLGPLPRIDFQIDSGEVLGEIPKS